jgi:hypothetical protein
VAFEHDRVTFRWKDYAHGNKKRMMTLGSQEFLRRFLLHVLRRGFVRIRFFRFLAKSPARQTPAPLSALAGGPADAAPTRSLHFLSHPAHLFPPSQMFYSHGHRRKTFCTCYPSINSVETTP